jgi:predicted CXXCH cytochrome family protein
VKHLFISVVLLAVLAGSIVAQTPITGDVLGVHDMSAGTSPVRGSNSSACLYCHAPHSGIAQGPLWSQTLSKQAYTFYSSDTSQNLGVQPALGTNSTLCLSCHDGTVAAGQTVPYGKLDMSGPVTSTVGTALESSHPFSLVLPLQDAASLVPTLASNGTTSDTTKAVKLVNGNVECSSCHNPHIQRVDLYSPNFLIRDGRKGALCLSCHTTAQRTVKQIDNPLVEWDSSVHALSTAELSPTAGLGGYTSVGDASCISCHKSHNAAGAKGLLRSSPVPSGDVDSVSQSCMSCHNGGDKLLAPILNLFAEYQNVEKKGHPFPTTGNVHAPNEPVVLDQNRHATCVDCHNSHASKHVTTFNLPPDLRPSQNGVAGVASDGSKLTTAASKQYETCLRCHGASIGKQAIAATYGYLPARAIFGGDALNLILQFGDSAASSHPVMRDATKQAQPSLLASMWDINGTTPTRAIGSRIFCTDCHNNDNNREFGGTGPNGPHASKNFHILERPYISSQVNPGTWPLGGPGASISNLNYPLPPMAAASGGPYSLCAKCHDLNNVMSNASFPKHSSHLNVGISCSVCHSAHGVPAGSPAGSSGTRLINFDVNVVAPNGGVISYIPGASCTLTCHMVKHNSDGSTQKLDSASPAPF